MEFDKETLESARRSTQPPMAFSARGSLDKNKSKINFTKYKDLAKTERQVKKETSLSSAGSISVGTPVKPKTKKINQSSASYIPDKYLRGKNYLKIKKQAFNEF